MPLVIRRVCGVTHRDTLSTLHTLTFPLDDHPEYEQGAWWIVYDGKTPVAFAGARGAFTEHQAIYLSRCGVLESHRGRGLQRRLLRVRLAYARRLDADAVITTTYANPPSGNNLIRAGFRLYDPATPWGTEGTCYWRRELQ